jgi:hypothetical protein
MAVPSSPTGADTVSTLDGLFKVQYAPDLNDLIPQFAILNRDIKYVPADKQNGKYYSVPCVLRSNQGVTYLGTSGGVGTLSTPINAIMQEAQVFGSELNIRGQLSYKALSQAASAGARAFKKASSWLVEDMTNVSYTRLELSALHGQLGLGVVEGSPVIAGNDIDVVISESEWAAGIWVVLEGAQFEFWSAVGANRNLVLKLSKVTSDTRTLRFTYISGSGSFGTIVAGDVIFPNGARESSTVYNEMAGLFKQYSPSVVSLFGIDRVDYSLLQGNEYDLNSTQLTSARVVEAASLALDKGLMSDATLLVGTKTFADLNAENMGLRMYDSSYSAAKAENGTKEIVYDHVNGKIKVICHPFVKGGQALLFSMDDVLMVGSSRPTFEIPGMQDRFFRLVDGSNAVEMQNYCDLAIFAHKPGQGVVLTGITHSDS